MKDEINDPIEKSFTVKFFYFFIFYFLRNVVLLIKFFVVFEGGREGDSKSFGRFHYVYRGVWSLWLSERLNVFYFFVRLSSGPPGGRPHARLKAGTSREAPTPAPASKTPVPTTVNRLSSRAEATRKAPVFKSMARRVDWAASGAPRQHRKATSHPSSRVGAGTYHWCESTPWPRGRPVGLQDCSGEKKQKPRRDSNSRLLPRGTNTAERACHTPVGVPAVPVM